MLQLLLLLLLLLRLRLRLMWRGVRRPVLESRLPLSPCSNGVVWMSPLRKASVELSVLRAWCGSGATFVRPLAAFGGGAGVVHCVLLRASGPGRAI